jgi:hypothetical protein
MITDRILRNMRLGIPVYRIDGEPKENVYAITDGMRKRAIEMGFTGIKWPSRKRC